MRIVVAAVGRLKQGPERDLSERYRKRAADAGRGVGFRGVEIIEIRESKAREGDKRILEESIALATVIPEGAVTIVLDERGENLDSLALTGEIMRWRDAGCPVAVFVIGGADGLAASLRERADLRLAFGAATWPHQLVRIMLLEQVYRAATLLAGHPYHRGQAKK
ncbi:MAG TPA: 23S rRNA (pseudouridine(1915)-N(3))-methyltransferase RlmH [Xanthobacteraceae bacterium]|jgi:23S rRNA (pseudouridine1915-N3)-methyltransferase|nr:23S rRNA (pseudouridine(1915)-N(3))-methyltransferase RlmH [Xanthobacteraceae bacterium]